jgi:hypothetical protein
MLKRSLSAAALLAASLCGAALAHGPEGHGDAAHYAGYDCTAMTGTYLAPEGPVRIDVVNEKVTLVSSDQKTVSGICIAPKIEDGTIFPQASVVLTADFSAGMGAESCCAATLKGNDLVFDKAAVTWARQ